MNNLIKLSKLVQLIADSINIRKSDIIPLIKLNFDTTSIIKK